MLLNPSHHGYAVAYLPILLVMSQVFVRDPGSNVHSDPNTAMDGIQCCSSDVDVGIGGRTID